MLIANWSAHYLLTNENIITSAIVTLQLCPL